MGRGRGREYWEDGKGLEEEKRKRIEEREQNRRGKRKIDWEGIDWEKRRKMDGNRRERWRNREGEE